MSPGLGQHVLLFPGFLLGGISEHPPPPPSPHAAARVIIAWDVAVNSAGPTQGLSFSSFSRRASPERELVPGFRVLVGPSGAGGCQAQMTWMTNTDSTFRDLQLVEGKVWTWSRETLAPVPTHQFNKFE